jgi:hypothetical protein
MEDLRGKAVVWLLILFVISELLTLLTLNYFTEVICPEIQWQDQVKENALQLQS